MATLNTFIKDPRVSAQYSEESYVAESPATRAVQPLPGMATYEFERSTIQSVVITADTDTGDTVYPAPSAKDSEPRGGDVEFFVTIEQFDVRWTVQRPFGSFARLHQYLGNADPTLAATLVDFLPKTRPSTPPEHDRCATEMQRYFEKALDGYKRIHQREFARIVSPKEAVGKLCSMEGLLSIKRHAHEPLPAQARWCRVSTTIPEDTLSIIMAGLVLGDQAERAEATGEPEVVANSLESYIEAKRLILPRLQDVEPEQQVELSQKLALWSRCIKRLKAERPGFIERANPLYTGSCLAVFESTEDRSAPAVSAVMPQDSTSPTGRRGPKMALTRGEPIDSWPIRQVELASTFVRTQPGCFRQLELINAETGARVRVGMETKEGYALWLAAFQKDCKGRLDYETQQADFSIAGVTETAAGDQPDYMSLNARTPDHTWLAHPRRGSLSLELEASTPKPRERRLSTDEEYLQELKDTFNPDVPNRQRARTQGPIRTQSISGSVSNSPPAAVHSDDTIVMDFGSHSLKAGRARDEFPVHIVRSVHPETGEPLVGELSGQELVSATANCLALLRSGTCF